jgi:adhesin/invasin
LTLSAVILSACDKVPLVAPAGTVITLVSNTNVLPINGATDIIAVLIESGGTSSGTGANATTGSAGTAVHNGTLVSFTTSLGKIEPAEARTVNGRVTVKLTADGRSGTAKITAFSGSATQTMDVVIGAAAAERVQVTASPTTLPANGGTAVVTARVEDVSGNPLFGVPVAFTTTAGTLSPVSAVTNEAGLALSSLSTTAAATVTATAGGKTGSAALTLKTAVTVQLSVPTNAITVGAPTTFTVTPTAGATLNNVVVDFGDGSVASLGTVTSASPVAHFYSSEDIFLVRVSGTDTDGQAVTHSGSVAVIGFTVNGSASPTSGALGTVFSFTVTGIPTTVPVDHVEWNFGNGTIRNTNSTSTSFEYTQRGKYTVVITVHPVHGPSRQATVEVSVT